MGEYILFLDCRRKTELLKKTSAHGENMQTPQTPQFWSFSHWKVFFNPSVVFSNYDKKQDSLGKVLMGDILPKEKHLTTPHPQPTLFKQELGETFVLPMRLGKQHWLKSPEGDSSWQHRTLERGSTRSADWARTESEAARQHRGSARSAWWIPRACVGGRRRGVKNNLFTHSSSELRLVRIRRKINLTLGYAEHFLRLVLRR